MVMMTTHEPIAPTGDLLQDFLSLETPEGYRAELIDGEIVVAPPADGNHGIDIAEILKQVIRHSATEMDFDGNKGLIVPARGIADGGRVIPDITFAPADLRLFHDAPSWMDATGVTMVVEVTSSRPDSDRNAKRLAYAGAGIPLYLLVDREVRRVTLFSQPQEGEYARTYVTPFGSKIELPKPFAFVLDTASFVN